MKKIIFYLLVFIIPAFLFSGCTGFQEVKVGNIKGLEVKGVENEKIFIAVVLPVENPNSHCVKVKDADIKVMNGTTELGRIVQMDNLVISGKTAKDYPINLTVELTGLKGNLFSIYRMLNGKTNLRITGKVKAGYGLYKKSIKIDKPLTY